MCNKYIHIGYPKNLSTTLQVDYFSKHSDIYHLGTGFGHNTGYRDNILEGYLENILFYSNELMYQDIKNEIITHIKKHYSLFNKSNKRAFGLSLEHISFSFTPADADIYIKFKRLREIFGKDTKIIAIIRRQDELIKSLYRESIRIGYPYSFKEYLDFLFYYQNYSYLLEINYDKVLNLLYKLFDIENIEFIPIEKYRDKSGKLKVNNKNQILLTSKLNSILGISNQDIILNHHNPTLKPTVLYHKLQLNRKFKHDLGNSIYEPVQKHRLKEYFNQILDSDVTNIYSDVKQKRLSIELAKELAKNDAREIDYYADLKILEKLKKMFIESNKRLVKKYNIDLPECYFNIKF
jgi:hypothetical protein